MMTAIAPLLFQGMLLNQQGAAIQNAKIQLWQTDLDGNYLHPDPGAAVNPASSDHASIVSDFQYFGTDDTDSDGRFQFLTYRPGVYPNRPYSHFHFMVWLNDVDNGGYDQALVTQFYFKDESPPYPEMLQLDVVEVDSGDLYDYGSYVNGTIVIETSTSSTGDAILEITPEQSLGPFYPIPDFFSMDNDLTAVDDTSTQTATPTVSPQTLLTSPPTIAPFSVVDDTSAQAANPTVSPQTLVTPSPTIPPVVAVDETSTQTANPTVSPQILVTPFPTIVPVGANISTKSPTHDPNSLTTKPVEGENDEGQELEGDNTDAVVEDDAEAASGSVSSAAYWQGLVTVVVGFTLLNVAFAT